MIICVAVATKSMTVNKTTKETFSQKELQDKIGFLSKEIASPCDENCAALDCHIEAWTCMRNPKTVVDLLQNHSITAGIIENAEDLAKDPCLLSRNFFTELIHPVLGKTISDRSAHTFSKDATDNMENSPLAG